MRSVNVNAVALLASLGIIANAASRPIMRLTVLTSLASKLGRHDLGPWHF